MLHAGIAAIGADRALVGYGLTEIDASILESIDTRKHLRPDYAAERFVARIGAAIIDVPRIDGGDYAVFVERDASIAEGSFVAVRAGNVVLGARFDPLDGAATSLFRGEGADCHLRVRGDFDAETSADIEGLHADTVDADAQVRGDELDGERWKGVVAPVVDLLVFRVPLADDGVVFERRARKTVEVHFVDVDYVRGFGECLLDVAVFKDAAPYLVGAGDVV